MPVELPAALREVRVHERLLVFTTGGESLEESYGANAVAVLGETGTLLVDPLVAPAYGREIRRLLALRGAAPVRWVVATHHHTDHVLGASVFSDDGVEVLVHPEAAGRMAVEHPALLSERRASPAVGSLFADAAPVVPTRAVGSALELGTGGLRAVVSPCGPAHTPGDLRVDLPGLGVVLTGDLVSNGYHPNLEDADLSGWRSALLALLRSQAATFVPGHGDPGGREIVEAQVAWLDAAEEIARRAGRGPAARERFAASLAERFPAHRLRVVLPTAAALLVPEA